MDEDFDDAADGGERMRQRLAAEAELDRRDERRRQRLPGAFDEDDLEIDRRRRRRLQERLGAGVFEDDRMDMAIRVNLDDLKGDPKEHLRSEPVKESVCQAFKAFLGQFTEEGGSRAVYAGRIDKMCKENRQSLEVSYMHLAQSGNEQLAMWLTDAPMEMLPLFHRVAKEVTLQLYPSYSEILGAKGSSQIFVRIVEYPLVDRIRDIRQTHLGGVVKTTGVVTRRTGVFPKLSENVFTCGKCGTSLGPFTQNDAGDGAEVRPNACPNCQSAGPFTLDASRTVYRNYQKITIQESPSTVPAGRLPRSKEVILLDDLIDCCRPGEEVEAFGVYNYQYDNAMLEKSSFPVFSTLIEANHISKKADRFAAYALTEEDKEEIQKLKQDPRIGDRIIKSIAPSIYGHSHIKTALALSMFGGQEKVSTGKHRIRGDINVLLLGDPGVAKSQFLKYVEKTAARAVYTTGKGASAVGLTAAVHRDPITREWTLEGGALVLADRGVCLIDEFDKMNDQDRVSIHEAMEQQSISVSKAGIVTTLQARCSVMAAANPNGGRYDPTKTLVENVDLTDPILSRFDILCVVRDIVDPVEDARLADFVIGSHVRNHPEYEEGKEGFAHAPAPEEVDEDVLGQDQLRKYVTYAKGNCFPKMNARHAERIATVYAELRRESNKGQSIPMAVRHLESIIRMAEAHARMHLRERVVTEDVDVAIRVMLESFIASQKLSVQKQMQRRFRKYITYKQDLNEIVMFKLRELLREHQKYDAPEDAADYRFPVANLKQAVAEYNIHDLADFLRSDLFTGNRFAVEDGMIVHPR